MDTSIISAKFCFAGIFKMQRPMQEDLTNGPRGNFILVSERYLWNGPPFTGTSINWQLPTKVCATYTKFNTLGAIIECEGVMWFKDGGRAVIDTSCLLPHRSQFEVVCEKGVLKVDDLVGGQGRSGNFSEYDHPYVGSKSYVLGDYLGKDEIVEVEPCDHVQKLVEQFSNDVQVIKEGGKANQEWSKISIMTHTVMCAIFESAMRDGTDVKLEVSGDGTTKYMIEDETYTDIPSRNWS